LARDSRVQLISFDQIQPESVKWLWPGRIPLGKITILQGDPKVGKSTVALDLAARVTRCGVMPDGRSSPGDAPAGVVVLTAEDGLADTVRPRLDATGANVSLVMTFGPDEHILIPRDAGKILAAIKETAAKLVVIDPMAAFLEAGINSWQNTSVRAALAPVAKIADETGAAVLAVDHLSKASGRAAIYRGNGSIAFAAAARSLLMAGKHPEQEDTFVLAAVGGNLARPAKSLAYQMEEAPGGAICVKWLGDCDYTAEDLNWQPQQERETKVQQCAAWLKERLAPANALESVIQAEALGMGFPERTFRRARRAAGVVSTRSGNFWVLSLAAATN